VLFRFVLRLIEPHLNLLQLKEHLLHRLHDLLAYMVWILSLNTDLLSLN
jgi:hypothetical protein